MLLICGEVVGSVVCSSVVVSGAVVVSGLRATLAHPAREIAARSRVKADMIIFLFDFIIFQLREYISDIFAPFYPRAVKFINLVAEGRDITLVVRDYEHGFSARFKAQEELSHLLDCVLVERVHRLVENQ